MYTTIRLVLNLVGIGVCVHTPVCVLNLVLNLVSKFSTTTVCTSELLNLVSTRVVPKFRSRCNSGPLYLPWQYCGYPAGTFCSSGNLHQCKLLVKGYRYVTQCLSDVVEY